MTGAGEVVGDVRAAADGPEDRADHVDLAALLTRSGIYAWALVGLMVAAWLLLLFLSQFSVLLGPIVLAVALIYVLNPVVTRLNRVGIHRVIGSMVAFDLR